VLLFIAFLYFGRSLPEEVLQSLVQGVQQEVVSEEREEMAGEDEEDEDVKLLRAVRPRFCTRTYPQL
jgi:hypothetical protein